MQNLSYGCPDHNLGGFKLNEQGMTLNPYFSDLKRENDTWSTLQKQDYSGRTPNEPKSTVAQLLGGQLPGEKISQPYEDLRNRWISPGQGSSSSSRTQSFGPSTYQKDYLVPPCLTKPVLGAEQMRRASLLPRGNNTYRPKAGTRWQGGNDWVPKRPLVCAPCTGVKIPCRNPISNISNVDMNEGFGTYISETMEQFDRPTAQAYEQYVYELPSGYSTSSSRKLWSNRPSCQDVRRERAITTPPQRYNPWPRSQLGYEVMLRNEYRPSNIDYQEATVAGTTSFDAHSYIY